MKSRVERGARPGRHDCGRVGFYFSIPLTVRTICVYLCASQGITWRKDQWQRQVEIVCRFTFRPI